MKREDIIKRFNEIYNRTLVLENIDEKEEYEEKDKVTVKCNKCHHSWPASLKNVIVFKAGCYDCCRGKGYSMDEIKILNYIKDNYIPKEHQLSFRHAEHGSQLKVIPNALSQELKESGFRPPLYYSCDGYSRITYHYDKETKTLMKADETLKGTVFEVLGDYHHSNPLYYKPDDISPRKGMTHKQNYEYTMNRLKHIEEQGFKVFYIWITDFRRFTKDLEKGINPNIFDYMNIEKKQRENSRPDYSLLSKGTQRIFKRKEFQELDP